MGDKLLTRDFKGVLQGPAECALLACILSKISSAVHKLMDMLTHEQQFHHHWRETGQDRKT